RGACPISERLPGNTIRRRGPRAHSCCRSPARPAAAPCRPLLAQWSAAAAKTEAIDCGAVPDSSERLPFAEVAEIRLLQALALDRKIRDRQPRLDQTMEQKRASKVIAGEMKTRSQPLDDEARDSRLGFQHCFHPRISHGQAQHDRPTSRRRRQRAL